MKPKGKTAKFKTTRLESARRKLSLPIFPAPKTNGGVRATDAGRGRSHSDPPVTSIYSRPKSLPFQTSSSSSSAATSDRSRTQFKFNGISKPAQDSKRVSTNSVQNSAHAVAESVAVNREAFSQKPAPKQANASRSTDKGSLTFAQARNALSLNDVILRPKVNVRRPDNPNTRPKNKVAQDEVFQGPKKALSPAKNPSAILEAVVVGEALVSEAIQSAQQRMKKIRFADEIGYRSAKPVTKKES